MTFHRPVSLLLAIALIAMAGAPPLFAEAAGTPAPPRGADPGSREGTLDSTRETIARWVETQGILSREKKDWQQGKEILLSRIEIVKRETSDLEESLKQTRAGRAETEKTKTGLAAERETVKGLEARLAERVAELETRVRTICAILPESLREKVQPLYQRMPDEAGATKISLAERFQNVLGILNEVNRLNGEISVVSEIRPLSDGKPSEEDDVRGPRAGVLRQRRGRGRHRTPRREGLDVAARERARRRDPSRARDPAEQEWTEVRPPAGDHPMTTMRTSRVSDAPPLAAAVAAGIALLALWVATPSRAEEAAAKLDAISKAQASVRQDLESSLQDLTRLREAIAAEKLPLSAELTRLEERLVTLRREHDQISRTTDEEALAMGNLRTESKLRHDEVDYLGTLLDEYRGSFESRLNAGELQRYEPLIAAAKDASGGADRTPDQAFESRLTLVRASVARLEDAIGGTRFPGKAIDPRGVLIDGRFAMIGPVTLFASDTGQTAGVALPQTGSTKPAVRPLGASLDQGVSKVVADGNGLLPLDPSRGGALKALIKRTSLIHIFMKGGPIMWPLLLASILALGTVVERLIFLVTEGRRRDGTALQRLLDAVEGGDMETAKRIGEGTGDYVCRALTYALVHRERSIGSALMLAHSLEIKRFSRGIAVLDTVITLAPLLGLLGTVTGMMSSFSLIGGDLGAPSAITGGIAEALIATAFGLGIAITALIPFNVLNAKVEEARHELDAASTRLELLLHPTREMPPARRPQHAHEVPPPREPQLDLDRVGEPVIARAS